MLIIEHRINTRAALSKVPTNHGVEIDVRHNPQTDTLYLQHDPGQGEELEAYLEAFAHRFIVFNVKEAGIEARIHALAHQHGLKKDQYFLLDVEFPYLYQASRHQQVRQIATRFSEAEPVAMALAQKPWVDWLWIDTNTQQPLTAAVVKQIQGFKTCLVGPDRWGRPEALIPYLEEIQSLGVSLDALMVGSEHVTMLSSWMEAQGTLSSALAP